MKLKSATIDLHFGCLLFITIIGNMETSFNKGGGAAKLHEIKC